jgi:NADPH-dependent curcumin reductase CurA
MSSKYLIACIHRNLDHHDIKCKDRIASHGVGIVVRSENPSFKAGDHIYGLFREQHQSTNMI